MFFCKSTSLIGGGLGGSICSLGSSSFTTYHILLILRVLLSKAESQSYAALRVHHSILDVLVKQSFIVVQLDLVVEQVHELVRSQVIELKVEIVGVKRICNRLVFRVMKLGEKWMFQCLLDRYSFLGCYDKHFLQEIKRQRVVVCEQFFECLDAKGILVLQ